MNKNRKVSLSEKKDNQYQRIFNTAPDGLIIADLETGTIVEANPSACVMHGYAADEFTNLHLTALTHPKSLPKFNHHLQNLKSDGMFDINVLEVCRDGSTFFANWRGTFFTYKGRSCLLGVVRDVSQQVQSEKSLRTRVEVRTQEQATLLNISHNMASTLELQPGLILDQLRGIVEYTHGGLIHIGRLQVGYPGHAWGLLSWRIPTLSISACKGLKLWPLLFNGHRPIRIADIWSDNPPAKFIRSLLNDSAGGLLEGMRSWMWVPLAVKARFIGGLGVAHEKRNYFTSHHANLALSVADQAAITMVNAELYEHAGELAALQERQRLAQNLHDAVNQSLFSAGLIAEVLPRLWDRDQAEARKSLEDLRRLTRGALAEMRALLAELRPSVLTDSSLGDLLRQLANAFTGRTNVPVSVSITGEHVLPAEIQVALYRVCQETLNNIAKHAEASQVEIDLHYDASSTDGNPKIQTFSFLAKMGVPQEIAVSSVEMHILDDGIGFDPGEVTAPGHYGMDMMRERAEAVGAQLSFTSQPGHGTEITLCWPRTEK